MNLWNPDFTRISYLSYGNERQKDAYRVLTDGKIMDILQYYHPVLVGTVPIGIDLPGSDLDILCEVHDFHRFEELIFLSFQDCDEFRYSSKTVNGIPRVVVNFRCGGWPIEIFGQPVPTTRQNGYKHMIVEHRILQIWGNSGRRMIRDLKSRGFKTEPAFAKLLKLEGDAYDTLLKMYDWGQDKLTDYLRSVNHDTV